MSKNFKPLPPLDISQRPYKPKKISFEDMSLELKIHYLSGVPFDFARATSLREPLYEYTVEDVNTYLPRYNISLSVLLYGVEDISRLIYKYMRAYNVSREDTFRSLLFQYALYGIPPV